jgi:hypothetical protein
MDSMNAEVRHVLSRVEHWPEDDQDELVQLALEIEARRQVFIMPHRRNSGRSTRRWRR